jgi:hypothetical protein
MAGVVAGSVADTVPETALGTATDPVHEDVGTAAGIAVPEADGQLAPLGGLGAANPELESDIDSRSRRTSSSAARISAAD